MLFGTHLFCNILRTDLCFSVYNKATQTVSTAIVIDGGGGGGGAGRYTRLWASFIPYPAYDFLRPAGRLLCPCIYVHVAQNKLVNIYP